MSALDLFGLVAGSFCVLLVAGAAILIRELTRRE